MVPQQLHFEWDRSSRSKGKVRREEDSVCRVAAASERTEPIKSVVIEDVVRREDLKKALKRVCAKKAMPNRFFAERGPFRS